MCGYAGLLLADSNKQLSIHWDHRGTPTRQDTSDRLDDEYTPIAPLLPGMLASGLLDLRMTPLDKFSRLGHHGYAVFFREGFQPNVNEYTAIGISVIVPAVVLLCEHVLNKGVKISLLFGIFGVMQPLAFSALRPKKLESIKGRWMASWLAFTLVSFPYGYMHYPQAAIFKVFLLRSSICVSLITTWDASTGPDWTTH